MDPPYHHHHRYAPLFVPPQNPNLYGPRTHPPPQQQPFQNPYNPRQSQFIPIQGINPRSHPLNHTHIQDFSLSPPISRRPLFNDPSPPRQQQHHHHHRLIQELWEEGPSTSLYLDHRLSLSPYRSIDKLRHEIESNPRFRDQIHREGDNIFRSRGDDGYHLRQRVAPFGQDSDTSSADVGPALNHCSFSSRGCESNLTAIDGRYRPQVVDDLFRNYGREAVSENQRRSRNRDNVRDARDSFIEMRNEEIGAVKSDYCGSDSVRYGSSRGSREDSHEYNNRTPRKQIKKMSAFLRIQKAKSSYRNREDERSHSSGYVEESKSSGLVSEDQNLDHVEREGSPVELDVSFKSNSLVAKAVVTPSSSKAISDVNLAPRYSKIRKALLSFDKDSSSSQMSKSVKLDCATKVLKNASDSDKDSRQTGIGNVGKNSSQKCSSGTEVSTGKRKIQGSPKGTIHNKVGINVALGTKSIVLDKCNGNAGSTIEGTDLNGRCSNISPGIKDTSKGMVSYKAGSNVDLGRISSFKVAKKKKAVKKIIKPRSQLSSSLSEKKHDEPLKADNSACILPASTQSDKDAMPLEESIATAGITRVPNVKLEPCLGKINVSAEKDKADGSPQTMVSSEVGYGGSCVPKVNGKRKNPSSPLSYSGLEGTKTDEFLVNSDNHIHSVHTISNTVIDLTSSPSEATISDDGTFENVSKQSYENGDSTLHKNAGAIEFLEGLLSMGCNNNSGLLNLEESILVNTCSFTHGMHTSTGNDSIKLQDSFTAFDIGTADTASKQPCTNQADLLVESDIPGESSTALAQVERSGILTLSNLVETRTDNSPIYADFSNHGRGIMLGTDNVCSNLDKIDHGTGDDVCKHLCPDGVTMSLDNDAIDRSPNTMVSVRGIEGDIQNNKNIRKFMTSQLDASSSMISFVHLGSANIVTSTDCLDTTLSLSAKDPCTSEAAVSDLGILYVGLHPCVDEPSVLDKSSSEMKILVSNDVNVSLSGASPENKRTKVSASHYGLSSSTASVINEGPVLANISTSGVVLPTNFNDALVQSEVEVPLSGRDSLCNSGLLPCSERISASPINCSAGGSIEAVGSVRDAYLDDGLKSNLPVVDSCLFLGESVIRRKLSICPSDMVGGQMITAGPVRVGSNHQNDLTVMDSGDVEKMDVGSAAEQVIIPRKTTEHRISSEYQSPDIDERLPGTDCEYDSGLLEKDGFLSVSNCLALPAAGDGISTSNANDELEFPPDTLFYMGSPEISSDAPGIPTLNCKASLCQISREKVSENGKIPDEKIIIEEGSNLSSSTLGMQTTKINLKFDNAMEIDHSVPKKTRPVASKDPMTISGSLNPMSGEIYGRKNRPVPNIYTSSSPFASTASKKTLPSSSIAKARTWHRTGSSSSSSVAGNQAISRTIHTQRPLPKKVAKFANTAYIRKGNSLVRKPDPVAALPHSFCTFSSTVHQLNPLGVGEVKKNTGSNSKPDVSEQSSFLRTGAIASFERPRTPPLTSVTKVPNRATHSSGDCTTSTLVYPHSNSSCEIILDPVRVSEINDATISSEDALRSSELPLNQTGSGGNLESWSELSHENLACSNVKRITYVKRKSNQLIATSNLCVMSVHNASESSDNYYKRSKNQLIRTSMESHINQTVTMSDDASNTECQAAPKLISSRCLSNKRSHKDKVLSKTRKPLKSSLVWTLHSSHLSRDDGSSLHHQVLPHLVPWKRPTCRRSFVQDLATMSSSNSFSTISRKLLLLRKRDTVYTRSPHGFSLRKSKVWSVGGSSLKWSKSIERNSKKANEEATLAVAAAERKKREQNSAGCIISRTKSRSRASRERVFRIGSVRYKMDASGRTLQRISDDESACSAAPTSENNAKKSYVPRRLVIGNDQYIRIGNGNQLVRDPKKRTRVLASEKVRWSLHTARLRLSRKRKYCQFFTRFGKCNKDDGKCPYIHDPSKIAVCTKFLNGLCSNPGCKLTHQVIPERMPDCSYFLQGLCTNNHCPYRHVHVNPNASNCEEFLRGYCSIGDECQKKHSYICPIFEATGSCPQGSKCKLHHPKTKRKGKKRKRSREQKNTQGRYFGSMHVKISEPGIAVSEKYSFLDHDDHIFEGRNADYISLGVSDEEYGESYDLPSEQTSFFDSDPSDLQLNDIDELIKPVRVMTMDQIFMP
ncbi:hypothetical protein CFOL_v3_25109 [Cephalotus follicularis]|uniref:C3H1-type domain-containing protein n=1 Tax=Cephalotus follicularis TaxID=3775 RepID=A0A1Q3CN98_CEPFO|nr:hypothetical protein CFOL_v3_25109 [Cephalotus follicularis]